MIIGIIYGGTGAEELANLRAVKDFEMVMRRYHIPTRRFYLNANNFDHYSFRGIKLFFVIDSNCRKKRNKKKMIAYIKKLKLPIIGQPETAIACARDKKKSNQNFFNHHIATPRSIIIKNKILTKSSQKNYREFISNVGYPIIVKDNFGSSSENLAFCQNEQEFGSAFKTIAMKSKAVLIEQYIGGSEVTAACVKIYGRELMLNPIEIMYKGYIYDYKIKNITLRNKLRVPPSFDKKKIDRIKKIAQRCHSLTGCNFYSRTDMKILDKKIVVLEINGEPILSKNDFVSRSAKSANITYPKLIIGLLCNSKKFVDYATQKNHKLKNFTNQIANLLSRL